MKKLVGEVCTMIRHKSVKKSSASREDSPIPQLKTLPEPLNMKPIDFIPARMKYGQSKSNPGSSTGLAIDLVVGVGIGAEVKESSPSSSPSSLLLQAAPSPPKISSPGRFLREDQSV